MRDAESHAASEASRPWKIGIVIAILVLAIDQVHKWWMLNVVEIGKVGKIVMAPFLDLVLVWNKGISYGLFAQESTAGWAGLLGATCLIIAILTVWLFRAVKRLVATALGLVIGGAIANVVDRIVHGAVADFFSFHAFGYYWYVFNLADVAIVAGVALLLYDSVFGETKTASD